MKKILFVAAIVALLMGTAVDGSAKVKKRQVKKAKAQTTKTVKSNGQDMKVDQGMYTAGEANRLENGDVSDLEMAFLQNFYHQYVFNGNIYNGAHFPYVKTKFAPAALEQITDAEGYDWSKITGRTDDSEGVTPQDFNIKRYGKNGFEVSDSKGFKCYIKVEGADGAYKITQVSSTPVDM